MYSIIIPVYNRPDEVRELLESLTKQSYRDFEVVIVEDGSSVKCDEEAAQFSNRLDITYHVVPNGGPAKARNIGATLSRGDYLIILDSDVVLPSQYLYEVHKAVMETHADAFGGPDAASQDFLPMQKAINYAMTSFITTGGIRGGKKKMDKFYPRSFNLGCRKEVYNALGGFSDMRFGEDIDFSLRLFKGGYKVLLFPEAFVYHKRRVDLKKFFKQVHNSGIARIHLETRHPGSMKAVHTLPALFTLGCAALLVLACFSLWALLPLLLLAFIIWVDAVGQTRSPKIALMAVAASYVQLLGYGSGFIRAWWNKYVLRKPEFTAFDNTFYN